MKKIKAILIDDMPEAIKNLKQDLADYCPQIEVIGEADGVISGAKLLAKEKPDVLFLDIQMQDGSGFDLLEMLPEVKFPVIFTTASDAFAIRAFKFSALDYLLKPIDPDELMVAVEKIKNHTGSEAQIDVLMEHIKTEQSPKKIALHTQEKIRVVAVTDIVRCASDGNYTEFYFSDGEKLLVTRTLKEYDQLLSDYGFIRVHQSNLVNASRIREFVKTEGGYLLMDDGSHVSVSLRKKAAVMKMLDEL